MDCGALVHRMRAFLRSSDHHTCTRPEVPPHRVDGASERCCHVSPKLSWANCLAFFQPADVVSPCTIKGRQNQGVTSNTHTTARSCSRVVSHVHFGEKIPQEYITRAERRLVSLRNGPNMDNPLRILS
jgi:hypothetical protein